MAIDERARHALHEAAIRAFGESEAATLMEHLPPVGWGDVATKNDLEQLAGRFNDRLEAVIHRAGTSISRWLSARC